MNAGVFQEETAGDAERDGVQMQHGLQSRAEGDPWEPAERAKEGRINIRPAGGDNRRSAIPTACSPPCSHPRRAAARTNTGCDQDVTGWEESAATQDFRCGANCEGTRTPDGLLLFAPA
jgi:hypothetical protein